MQKFLTLLAAGALLMFLASPTMAEPVCVYTQEPLDPIQDEWVLNGEVHECGWDPPFGPGHEVITSSWRTTDYIPCPNEYQGGLLVEVTITNECCCYGRPRPLWYVADPGTSLTNYDEWVGNCGLSDAEEAFKIDSVGENKPLVFESMGQNDLFEHGETWKFVIQDYNDACGIQPHLFNSLGIASLSTGCPPSTGSIIPEPATLGLLALGALALLRRRS